MQFITSQRQGPAAKSGLFIDILWVEPRGCEFFTFLPFVVATVLLQCSGNGRNRGRLRDGGAEFFQLVTESSCLGFRARQQRTAAAIGAFFPAEPFPNRWPAIWMACSNFSMAGFLAFILSASCQHCGGSETVRPPDLAVVTVYHDFTPLIAGDFAGTLDGFLLRGANRGGPAVAFAHNGPAARSFHDILFNSHIFRCFASLGLLTEESSFKSFEPSIHCP